MRTTPQARRISRSTLESIRHPPENETDDRGDQVLSIGSARRGDSRRGRRCCRAAATHVAPPPSTRNRPQSGLAPAAGARLSQQHGRHAEGVGRWRLCPVTPSSPATAGTLRLRRRLGRGRSGRGGRRRRRDRPRRPSGLNGDHPRVVHAPRRRVVPAHPAHLPQHPAAAPLAAAAASAARTRPSTRHQPTLRRRAVVPLDDDARCSDASSVGSAAIRDGAGRAFRLRTLCARHRLGCVAMTAPAWAAVTSAAAMASASPPPPPGKVPPALLASHVTGEALRQHARTACRRTRPPQRRRRRSHDPPCVPHPHPPLLSGHSAPTRRCVLHHTAALSVTAAAARGSPSGATGGPPVAAVGGAPAPLHSGDSLDTHDVRQLHYSRVH